MFKNGKRIDCRIVSSTNDSLITIDYKTDKIRKFAIADIEEIISSTISIRMNIGLGLRIGLRR